MLTTCASPHITYCWRKPPPSLPSTLRAYSAAAWGLEVAFIIVSLGTAQAIFVGSATAEPRSHRGACHGATDAVTRETKAKGTATLASSDTQLEDAKSISSMARLRSSRGSVTPRVSRSTNAERGRAEVGLLPAVEEGTVARRSRARRHQIRLRSVTRRGFVSGSDGEPHKLAPPSL